MDGRLRYADDGGSTFHTHGSHVCVGCFNKCVSSILANSDEPLTGRVNDTPMKEPEVIAVTMASVLLRVADISLLN
ncbi:MULTISPECIES: hypothetical protein [unclassified Lelliottia]|uniref:hypothetical protein n=1 Tax=unclassified Lelliottia TaxID=2642424 RepID=UPI0011AF2CD4|nr:MULTISPECIES: hypothetical protein [unclassified Lelliottia]